VELKQTVKLGLRRLVAIPRMKGVYIRARTLMGANVDFLRHDTLPGRFSAIYRDRVWLNDRESGALSGLGSEVENTRSIRQRLPETLTALGVRTLLDVGCGDFTWMQRVELPCRYIGVDVVEPVIEANRAAHGSASRSFHLADATREPLPEADAVLCREVLFHLSFDDIRRVIENVRGCGASYLIATNDDATPFNVDILSGDFRKVNLRGAPFLFPEPILSIPDDSVARGRALSVWKIASLPARIV